MNICVCGTGRAGTAMLTKLMHTEHIITGAIAKNGSPNIGVDVGEYIGAKPIGANILSANDCVNELNMRQNDLIIDFSSCEFTNDLLNIAESSNSKLVICTTNHTVESIKHMEYYTKKNSLGVVYAPSLTLGINLLIKYVAELSKILPNFDFEIVERHNKSKPRGTMTARIISDAIGRGETHIASVRAGGYVGIHEVTCANENERITITHESFSRQAFADGALMAANFIYDKTGFYSMEDVVNSLLKGR